MHSLGYADIFAAAIFLLRFFKKHDGTFLDTYF